jgi:hypothetical protein
MPTHLARWWWILAVLVMGCGEDLGTAPPRTQAATFGDKFYTISCQRVAYTSSLRAQEVALAAYPNDPSLIPPVDVSGSRFRLACRFGPKYLPAEAAKTDPKVATLVNHHDPYVQAINLIFPGDELSELQDYMIRILPLTDNDAFPAVVRRGAEVIGELEKDSDLHWSLARLDGRSGYRPRAVCLGIMRELFIYPQNHELLEDLLGLVGEGGKGHQALLDLLEALSLELRTTKKTSDPSQTTPVHPGDSERTLKLGLDLLLTQNPAFGSSGAPMLLTRRDWRGLARVQTDASGKLPAPFVDADGDRLPDVDLLGRFVGASGKAVPAPFVLDASQPDAASKRDADGRALDAAGNPIFEYINLDNTLLAALTRDALGMIDPLKDIVFRLVVGLTPMLGERRDTVKVFDGESLRYRGFDTTRAPVLDLAHAALQLGRDSGIDGTLEATSRLLKDNEGPIARLVAAGLDVKERGKKHPEAVLDPQSNLFDDLVVVLQKITRTPGLLEDVLHAMADPATRNLGGMLQNYINYRDVHVLDSSQTKVVNKSDGQAPVFKTLVDRTKPDTAANRSIQQRLMHIINNTNGMKMCNKEGALIKLPVIGITVAGPFKACDLFEVPNAAAFYGETIARLRDASGKLTSTPKGHLRLKVENLPGWAATIVKTVGEDTVLKLLTGIDGMSAHPTTEAVNRLMFMNPLPSALADVEDPAVDIDNHEVRSYFEGTLVSWEVPHTQFSCSPQAPCQFFDALRPVIQAFADHNAEPLFMDLMSVLHRHWASRKSGTHQFTNPKAVDFAYGSQIVAWEPFLAEVLGSTDLMPALNTLTPVLDSMVLSDGRTARAALAQTVSTFVDPARLPGLKYRDGRASSKTTDGKSTVAGGVSIFYLFADAFAAKRAALAKAEQVLVDDWNESTSQLVDLYLTVTGTGVGSRFKNRHIIPAGTTLIDFLRARIKSHSSKGDVVTWLGETLPDDIERMLGGPIVARAADLLRIVEAEPKVKTSTLALITHLLGELQVNATFRSTVTGLADLIQLLLDDDDLVPAARAVGKALDPKHQLVASALRFLGPAVAADKRQAISKILRNSAQEQLPGKSPLGTLLDLSTELHRVQPGVGTPYTGADFAEALRQARDFLANQETGLEKFFDIVKSRCDGPCATN